jgi:hypothetical protein
MSKPGRESLASLEIPSVVGLPERPEPLSHLTAEEAEEWRNIVATKPADWFMRDAQPVLAAYCQAIVMHRELMGIWRARQALDAPEKLLGLKDLVSMVNKTANLVAQLATKLRLTPQSRYNPRSASTANSKPDGRKLWQKA